MNQRQHHGLEKIELQLAAAAAMAAAYFIFWPLLRQGDPLAALSFLAGDGWGRLWAFAAVFWILAAGCAVLTLSARPQTALIAALFGAGGLSLRSPQMRTLFWKNPDSLGSLYGTLAVELLLLAAIFVVGMLVVAAVRAVARLFCRSLLWQGAVTEAADVSDAEVAFADDNRSVFWGDVLFLVRLCRLGFIAVAPKDGRQQRKAGKKALARTGMCLLLSLVISATLLLSLIRSPDRGQVLFALAGSFLVGGLIAHQVFPAPLGGAAWLLPVAAGLVAYALGAASAVSTAPQGWMNVQLVARALPLDWLTAGGGGAMLGYWISARMHEARFMEAQQEPQGA